VCPLQQATALSIMIVMSFSLEHKSLFVDHNFCMPLDIIFRVGYLLIGYENAFGEPNKFSVENVSNSLLVRRTRRFISRQKLLFELFNSSMALHLCSKETSWTNSFEQTHREGRDAAFVSNSEVVQNETQHRAAASSHEKEKMQQCL
jgi:hypothetical protein